jgi:glyoxylase-like metal-dependent hydrolase (beta-lactamase superfamily II)
MMREFSGARLVIHPRGARHMIEPAKLIAGVTEVYGARAVAENFGEVPPVPAERVIEAPDNFTLDFNGRVLRFLDTPGHARHHFCVWDQRSGSVFSGDTFGISYRELDSARGAFIFPTMTPVQLEPEALHRSIDRLTALKPRQILLTHFGRITEIERLAADLHEVLNACVAMARAVRASGAERHRRLVEGQREILLPRIKSHGCKFDPDQIEALIGGDFELNAQGLGVWLDREANSR